MRSEKTAVREPDLVLALARQCVQTSAPEELPLFEATSAAFLASPEAVETGGTSDETLGFGIEIAAALAPYALVVARAVVSCVYEQIAAAAKEESEGAIRSAVHRVFAKITGKNDEAPVTLSREQLGRVREAALAKAHQLGLDEARGMLLADGMVGALASP